MGPVEDPDFAKQNDRNSAARPLTDIPTKLLKQGFNVPPRQAAAYGSGEDQLKRWCFRFIQAWYCISVPGVTSCYRLPVISSLDTDNSLLADAANHGLRIRDRALLRAWL